MWRGQIWDLCVNKLLKKFIFSYVFTATACNDHRQKLRFSVSSHGRIIYMNDEKEENKTEDEEE